MNAVPLKRSVLFTGDKIGKLKDISFAFQQAGFSVLWSITGIEAIRVARLERPNLIVTEARLPDISGTELCRTIRDMIETHHTPLVFVDEVNDSRTVFDALEAGANDFFHPLVDPARFVENIVVLINQRRLGDHRKTRRRVLRFRHRRLRRSRTAPVDYAEHE